MYVVYNGHQGLEHNYMVEVIQLLMLLQQQQHQLLLLMLLLLLLLTFDI